jgi:hypothetical protein
MNRNPSESCMWEDLFFVGKQRKEEEAIESNTHDVPNNVLLRLDQLT